MKYKIHREGLNIIFVLLFILLAFNVPAYLFIEYKPIPIVFMVISAILFLLVINFFRSPRRHYKGEVENTVLSSVDGTVVALEEVYEDECLHCNCIQLSVFMSVFNVHANWVPVNGIVKYVKHHNGRFLAAYLPKSSNENERSTIVIKSDAGPIIMMRQVAGAMARRIVTYINTGDKSEINSELGFIKFGSRIDLFLPLDAKVLVKMGERVKGNVTPIAKI